MKKILKTKTIFLITTVLACLCFCLSVGFTAYAFAFEGKTSSLGGDLKDYLITKMFTDEESVIAGTQDGEIFAEKKTGEHIWNVGKIFNVAV